jgi:hypothetical protein
MTGPRPVTRFSDVVDEQKDYPTGEEKENELGEGIGRAQVAGGIHERGHDQQYQRRDDRVARIEPFPLRVHHV